MTFPFKKKVPAPDMGDCMAMGNNAVLQTFVLSYANDLKRQASVFHESSRIMRNRAEILKKRLNRLPPLVLLVYNYFGFVQRFDKRIRAAILKRPERQWQAAIIDEIEALAARYKAEGDNLLSCAKDFTVSLAKARDELNAESLKVTDPETAADLREAYYVALKLTSFIDGKAGSGDNAKTA